MRPGSPRLASLAVPLVLAALAAVVLASCGGGGVDSGSVPRTRHAMAMGTLAELKLYSSDAVAADRAFDRAVAELERLEALTTTHDEASETSRLNAAAGGAPESVSPEVDEMLRLSLEIADLSRGAFDPTAGALVTLWGFPEHPALPSPDEIDAAVGLVDWRSLLRTEDGTGGRAWRLARPGMRIDLGGVAKGWAVDAAADLAEKAAGNCLVNVGGDLVVRGAKPDGRPWVIGVQDPRDPSEIFLRLRLDPGLAVATSGDYQRRFEADGVSYHHLLDPATGWPARRASSATVLAPSCALADAWATAAFVLGPEEGIRVLEAVPSLEGVVVSLDEAGELVVRETSGVAARRID